MLKGDERNDTGDVNYDGPVYSVENKDSFLVVRLYSDPNMCGILVRRTEQDTRLAFKSPISIVEDPEYR